jgi:hypothetical protein
MANISIYETELNAKKKGVKLAIFRAYPSHPNPAEALRDAVSQYVGTNSYNDFVEANLDNPNLRMVISDIDALDFEPFGGQKMKTV